MSKLTEGMLPVWALTCASLLITGLAHAETPDWSSFNQGVAEQHLLPRYAQLEAGTQQLQARIDTLCATPNQDNLSSARDAWRASMQDWQGIQHVQFGPVTFLMRNFGLQYWPDPKNIGARQLRQVLTLPAAQSYDDEFFRHASISVQGYPALERLLFSEPAQVMNSDSRACELAQAIAGHVAAMSRAIHQEWQQTAASYDDSEAEVAKEQATEILAALVNPLEAIRDTKLLKAMGENAEAARSKRLESYRSGISLDNIRSNLAAQTELYNGTQPSVKELLINAGEVELAARIEQGFKQTLATLQPVASPLRDQLDKPEARVALEQAAAQLKQLSIDLDQAMSVLNIQLGFNSRDGD